MTGPAPGLESHRDRVFLVTGSGRGLGAAIARGAGSAGARVVLNCRQDLRGAEALAVEIEAAGGKAVVCRADVTDPVQARQLVEAASIDGPMECG